MNSLNTTPELENTDLENFSDAYNIGLAQILNKQKDFCLKLEQQYNDQKKLLDNKNDALIQQQKDLLEQEKKKYFGKYDFALGLIISVIICPLLLFFVPYSIIYYYYRQEKLKNKEQELERKYRPFFNNLNQREEELLQKYQSVKEAHQLRPKMNDKQYEFWESSCCLFSNLPQKGHVVLLYQAFSTNSLIRNQYSIFRELSFKVVPLDDLLVRLPVPLIVVGSRTLLFFPQALIIEENQQYYQIPYDNLKIMPHAERDVLKNQTNEGDLVVQELWEHARVDGTQDRRYKNNTCRYIIRYYGIKFVNKKQLCIPIYFSNEESFKLFMSSLKRIISYK